MAWPPELASIEHGDLVWAAYVAVGLPSFDSPEWAEVEARLAAVGYEVSGGELACDVGAPEALGQDPQTLGMAVYFASQADAQQFAELYEHEVVGVVEVQLLCLD
jgi:hypothetical protein